MQSRVDDAILWLEKARVSGATDLPWVHLRLASAYSLKGETKRAAAELAEAQRMGNGRHDLSIGRLKAGLLAPANMDPVLETTYYAGLRKAGVREQ